MGGTRANGGPQGLEGEGREREEGGRGVEMNRDSPATPSRLARDLRVFLGAILLYSARTET